METPGITNRYSELHIPQINQMGTGALRECLTLELEQRGVWDDELKWSLDTAMRMHEGETRKDGPYTHHILRVGLWAVREFNTFDGELAKAAILHDLPENHAEEVIEELGLKTVYGSVEGWLATRPDRPDTRRQQAVWMLGESGRITSSNTVTAIGNLTCPVYPKSLPEQEKHREYALHIVEKIVKVGDDGLLVDPIACAAKIADQIDNGNGNHYNKKDLKMRSRLDRKYLPVNKLLRKAVKAPNSLIPITHQDTIVKALKNGHEAARLRLLKGNSEVEAMAPEEVDALSTLDNVLRPKVAA